MLISAVLRTSPTFDVRHLNFLAKQVREHYPEHQFLPFTDAPFDGPHVRLESDLPKWWGKMEIARYETDEPILVIDLDTVILKPVHIPTDRSLILRCFLGTEKMAGGMVLWTPDFRRRLAEHFWTNPRRHMAASNWDDQRYYRQYHKDALGRFQDVLPPDAVASYKLTTQYHGLRPGNAFVFFHGEPRPWDLSLPWIPKLETA